MSVEILSLGYPPVSGLGGNIGCDPPDVDAEEEIYAAAIWLHPQDSPIEVRPTDDHGQRYQGVYSNFRQLAKDAADWYGNAVQWTINMIAGIPVTNSIERARKGGCVGSKHITRIRNVALDFDPRRPAGCPSTDLQHAESLIIAKRVRDHLKRAGYPDPLIISSGNGTQMFYPANLSVTAVRAVRRFVHDIKRQFETPAIIVDDTVWSLAQLMRVPGTRNRKVPNGRYATILELPERTNEIDDT